MSTEEQQVATKPTRPPTTSRQTAAIIAAVIKKYTDGGWVATLAPRGSINDIIAQRNNKYHFVQVINGTTEADGGARMEQLAKNTFIQNAFANGAIPVVAFYAGPEKISFQDINIGTRVVVGRGADAKTGPKDAKGPTTSKAKAPPAADTKSGPKAPKEPKTSKAAGKRAAGSS